MSINPIEENSTPKPTGNLEDLFRHHLGEEAAVPPRPMLWDQIDNSLLVRQNETYRRRLAATRWVAAASLVLASLAGTGWWSLHDASMGGAAVATATPPTGAGAGSSAAANSAGSASNSGQVSDLGAETGQTAAPAVASAAPATANEALAGQGAVVQRSEAVNSLTQNTRVGFGSGAARSGLEQDLAAVASNKGPAGVGPAGEATAAPARAASGTTVAGAGSAAVAARGTQPATTDHKAGGMLNQSTAPATAAAITPGAGSALVAAAPSKMATARAASVAGVEQASTLAARPAALSLTASETLPGDLATLSWPEPEAAPAVDAHKWHYGASYTVGAFNPNINFSRAGIEPEYGYNPALGADSPALTETAAAQYREHLRPGLSQRLALLATRRLTGRWTLRTGAEFSQATAQSATSLSFLGEQLPDLGQSPTGALRTTDFRYRLASVPLEVRYADPVKRGWSLYGRLGGVVSALLGTRSEVEGEPEATKTYSLASAAGPYRRVLGSVRGAAGAQFRPGTGNWAFTLSPVAELGLVPLNAHPAQSYLAQSRPYSFGVEAGVEFGR